MPLQNVRSRHNLNIEVDCLYGFLASFFNQHPSRIFDWGLPPGLKIRMYYRYLTPVAGLYLWGLGFAKIFQTQGISKRCDALGCSLSTLLPSVLASSIPLGQNF